jgi:hypothetical protein
MKYIIGGVLVAPLFPALAVFIWTVGIMQAIRRRNRAYGRNLKFQ